MAVYKDSERGTYYFITRINGKQVKRRGFKTKSEAKRAEAKAFLDFEEMNDENPSFENIAKEYLNWYEKRRKLSSYTKISSIVNIHLIPYFGNKKLNAIRPRHVTIYQDSIIDKFAPSHVKKIHTVLSAIFNYAIKQEYTKDNPARTVGNVELEEDKHINFWILDEFKTFVKHVDNFMYYTLFMILYYSGMRKGELLALTWADIDFDNNLISVNKTAYNRVITKPKTRSSIRQIKMPKHVMRLLSQLKADNNPKMTYVVFGEFHDHISTTTLDRKYEHWVKVSQVKKIRLHDFRHSHASYLINNGTIASVIAMRLGHSNVATTLNVYSHLYPSTEEEAVLKMEDDFKPAEIIQLGAN
ncbi:tyrosine-type recombinase/integrase [Terribacillus saccharophilus]|uniref:tyrosine-type recombinase/integrase n=1 Tax=Terribacillus saccharophilus TaxID=361277 RepID=UPI002DC99DC8|nr:tyrosine-type recombinase/integrase [Terribacillus saccharophilus]MEC0288948.1 tyrosine-type recombinase/integrase [Terribacillus saccharophilus]